jgi:hypothetical protein
LTWAPRPGLPDALRNGIFNQFAKIYGFAIIA